MNTYQSPDKPGSEGYLRVCLDCGHDMTWDWGGPNAFFQCTHCGRVEPTADVVIERSEGTVTLREGNKKQVTHFPPDDFKDILHTAITNKPPQP